MKRCVTFIIIIFILPSVIFAEEWHVKESENNLVKFTSSTTLLDFEGITSNIDGYIYWEGDKIFGEKNELYFEVDLNSVETGIGKRDRDMREDVLETNKWPKSSFKGNIIQVIVDESIADQYFVTALGNMVIHGHQKELEIKATLLIRENIMNVKCDFSVFLKDYDIEAPSLLAFVKVAEEIKINLNYQLKKISENEN